MPLYFFPAADGASPTPDPDGVDYATLDEACSAAVRALTEMARDTLEGGTGPTRMSISVTSADGEELFRATLEFRSTRLQAS